MICELLFLSCISKILLYVLIPKFSSNVCGCKSLVKPSCWALNGLLQSENVHLSALGNLLIWFCYSVFPILFLEMLWERLWPFWVGRSSVVLTFSYFWPISLSFSSTLWKTGLMSTLLSSFVCFGDFFAEFLFCFLFVWGYLMFNVQELIFCFLIVF